MGHPFQNILTGRGVCLCFLAMLLAACNDSDMSPGRGSRRGPLYLDYQISGEEGKEEVTCLLQFRSGGPEGNAIALTDPARVELDGEELTAQNAGLSGIYYEASRPAREFAGRHRFTFTDLDGKQYREEFSFSPFNLDSLPDTIRRAPFFVRLGVLPAHDTALHLILVDTAWRNNDVNENVRVVNGRFAVTGEMLARLKNGPISMEVYSEQDRPLRQGPKGGGRLLIIYGLKREFELR